MIPEKVDLRARRNTPFSRVWTFTDDDGAPVDFTGASVDMQVRLYGAQPGDAQIDLVQVFSDHTEGLLIGPGSIQCWVDEITLKLLPTGVLGEDVRFIYDMKIQQVGSVSEIWTYGNFDVTPGVTDRLIFLTDENGNPLTGGGDYLLGS